MYLVVERKQVTVYKLHKDVHDEQYIEIGANRSKSPMTLVTKSDHFRCNLADRDKSLSMSLTTARVIVLTENQDMDTALLLRCTDKPS